LTDRYISKSDTNNDFSWTFTSFDDNWRQGGSFVQSFGRDYIHASTGRR